MGAHVDGCSHKHKYGMIVCVRHTQQKKKKRRERKCNSAHKGTGTTKMMVPTVMVMMTGVVEGMAVVQMLAVLTMLTMLTVVVAGLAWLAANCKRPWSTVPMQNSNV